MLFKESWLFVTDNTNVRWIKIFQLYKGFHRKSTKIGFFVKGSARIVEPPRVEYKGFKYKYSIKGDIIRMLIVRSSKKESLPTGSQVQLPSNAGISIKKRSDSRSRFNSGPITRALGRRKLSSLFKKVIF